MVSGRGRHEQRAYVVWMAVGGQVLGRQEGQRSGWTWDWSEGLREKQGSLGVSDGTLTGVVIFRPVRVP